MMGIGMRVEMTMGMQRGMAMEMMGNGVMDREGAAGFRDVCPVDFDGDDCMEEI